MSAPTLFAQELRAGREDAIARLRLALDQGGSLKGAANILGINRRTLEDWASPGRKGSIPAVLDTIQRWRQADEPTSQEKSDSAS